MKRLLNMDLPRKQSAFLWGARKTGKSYYLKSRFPKSVYYDLLKTDEYLRLVKAPWLLREEILKEPAEALESPVIIDEIQKVPALLNEVHWLIENAGASFILCGSSARKLKRGAANLLGGRAWRYHFFPLVSAELPELDLIRIFNQGLLPAHYLLTSNVKKTLNGYIEDYLKEEIQAEGLVRSLPHFAKFLDVAALCNTEMLNFSNIARDCGVDAKTVRTYFDILLETLLAYLIFPFQKKMKRDLISATPRFYFFDVGISNRLNKWECEALQGSMAGKSFEHFILMELMAYQKLKEQDWEITYWRTKQGYEVDFVLGDALVGIEVKLQSDIDKREVRGLLAFLDEHPKARAILVAPIPRKRLMQIGECQIEVFPYQEFLTELWRGDMTSQRTAS